MNDKKVSTKRELEEMRKKELKELADTCFAKWITNHPFITELAFPKSHPNAEYAALYNHSPKVRTKSELDRSRKNTIIAENEAAANFTNLTPSQRVEQREKIHSSYNIIKDHTANRGKKRKTEDISQLEKLFSKRPIGIHGIELPKFSENCKDYWKSKEGYVETPHTLIKQSSSNTRPISEYGAKRSKSSNTDIPLKPNEFNPLPNFEISTEIKDIEKRSFYKPRFSANFFYSSSAKSSQERNLSISASEKEKSKVDSSIFHASKNRRERPNTAITGKNKINRKLWIRSQGFAQ